MSRSSCVPPLPLRFVASVLFSGVFFVGQSFAAPKYDIRASTKDKVRTFLGNAKQGSFGAPTLNDKGSVAYACVMFGNNVDAFTNNSIVYRKKGKKGGASTAVQAGVYNLDSSFLPYYDEDRTYAVVGSASIFKISKAIAINNKNQIGFTAEVLNTVRTDTVNDTGDITNSTFRVDDRSDVGCVFPSSTVAGGYQNVALSIYLNFFAEILDRTLSINSTGSVPENATYVLTPSRTVPGFDYVYPIALTSRLYQDGADVISAPYFSSGGAIVATTESNVIGLPYETVYSSFSEAIIADNNRVFITADISDTGDEFDGIWQGTNPNLQPIVVKQTNAPGGGKFSAFDGKIGPNRKGTAAAFIADVTGGSSTRGVFRSNLTGKQVDLIASAGDKGPDTDGTFIDFDLAAASNRGAVAILGRVTGGTGGTGLAGIWVSDPAGKNLKLVVIAGQKMVIGKKTKTITRIAFNPVAAINKQGQVAFTASFSDKTSSVIVATP